MAVTILLSINIYHIYSNFSAYGISDMLRKKATSLLHLCNQH